MTDLPRRCKSCRWFDPDFAKLDTDEESLGLCEWPADRLPYSLRYGNRERMAVSPLDGADCPCFEPRQRARSKISLLIGKAETR